MKKNIILLCVCVLMSQVIFAQLKVVQTGNVGVGTTTPSSSYKLDVVGNTRVTGNIYLGSASNFWGTTGSSIPITFKVNNVLAGFTGHSGNTNISFGYGSLPNVLTSGVENTAIGYQALYSKTTGGNNVAVGYQALYSNMTGSNNVANGAYALRENTGTFNTAVGHNALRNNQSGSRNTATGMQSLVANTIGIGNTATGYGSLSHNNTGSYNTVTGHASLTNNQSGSYNTAIGTGANVGSDNLSNATAIGYNAVATTSNQVRLGNTSVTSVVAGNNVTIVSDGRTKKNIRANVQGLTFINQLQPDNI